MDVEGHEFEIIEGGWKTIERFKPDICMELHISILGFGRAVNLLARLMRIGYRIDFAAPRYIITIHCPLLNMWLGLGERLSNSSFGSSANHICVK
jgi:hypothetical protein